MPLLCPFKVRTNSQVAALHTLIVLSPLAETIKVSSKSTTLTAALWPTKTRRRSISVGETISQTAMERSLEQVTSIPLWKRRWRTASQWWTRVLRSSPVVTSQILTVASLLPEAMIRSSYCRQRTEPVCPTSVCSHWRSERRQTLIVLSRRPEIILLSSYWRQ